MAYPPPSPGASPLDSMPPSPAMLAGEPGASAGMSPDVMGGPIPVGSGQLPPEILQGVMAIGQQIAQLYTSLAQITPDLGPDWQAQRQLLLATLSKLLVNGAGPAGPTDPGMAFPGVVGGMDRGRPV